MIQWLYLSDEKRHNFYFMFLNFLVYNEHIFTFKLRKKIYVTKSLELRIRQRPVLQPASCVLTFHRFCGAHTIYMEVLFCNTLSLKPNMK